MTDWATCANIAQVVGTLLSAGTIFYLAKQVGSGNRAEDLRSLYDFYLRAEDVEARLIRERGSEGWDRVRYEPLNFLEVSSEAYLRRLFGKVSSVIVRDKLIDSLAFVWGDDEMRGIVQDGVTGPTTFSGMMSFYVRHKHKIDGIIVARREMAARRVA